MIVYQRVKTERFLAIGVVHILVIHMALLDGTGWDCKFLPVFVAGSFGLTALC